MISPEELLKKSKLTFEFPKTLEINNGVVTVSSRDFSALVARWVRYFRIHEHYHTGVIVNFEHWTTDVLACYMGLIFSSTPYYALNTATMREDSLRALYDRGIRELIYLARPYNHYPQEHLELFWEIGFDTDNFLTIDPGFSDNFVWTIDLDAANFYCFTSGTTGEPKLIQHTHRSVFWAATNAAQMYYSSDDRVLLNSLPNHIGVMTMAVLSPLLAGAHVVLGNFSDPDLVPKYNYCNKTLLFYYQLLNDRLDAVEFSHYNLIITGGEAIRQDFLDRIFARGVNNVVSVYGLTEAMPPVASHWFNKPTLTYDLGDFTAGISVNVHEDVLLLKGPNSYTWPEWLRTGDLVESRNSRVHFKTRAVNSVRRGGELINVDRLKECCELWGLRDFILRTEEPDRISAHAELETQVILLVDQLVDLHSLNKHVVEQLGENYRITMQYQADVARNDIYKATRL